MTRTYRILLRLYPLDIRLLYGDEMVSTFDQRFHERRAAVIRFLLGQLIWLVCDATDEWLNKLLSSHPSFRGRCRPDAGVVRPPDVGKKEWFGGV